MPRPSAAANHNLIANVAAIRTATSATGVFSQAAAGPRARSPPPIPSPAGGGGVGWRRSTLPAAEIFLIRCVVLDQHAAIDGQCDAGDHARRVTRQKQNGIGDVLGLAHA